MASKFRFILKRAAGMIFLLGTYSRAWAENPEPNRLQKGPSSQLSNKGAPQSPKTVDLPATASSPAPQSQNNLEKSATDGTPAAPSARGVGLSLADGNARAQSQANPIAQNSGDSAASANASEPSKKSGPVEEALEEEVATLGLLDRTQQEILILQAQLEREKLRQQLNKSSNNKEIESLGLQSIAPSAKLADSTTKSSEKILLIYQINDKKYVRLQLNNRYSIDLQEGQTLPSGEKLIAIGSNEVIFEDSEQNQRTLSIF